MSEARTLQPSCRDKGQVDWSVTCDSVTVIGRSRPILDNLACRISPRGISVIMGANGAGKSVLLRVMSGLIRPSSGQVRIHPAIEGKTGMVFQRPVLLRRSVEANLDHALRIARFGKAERQARIDALLETGGLKSFARQPARSLSGGEQQRLQMARALAAEPKLLLMDEPTASLDPGATLAIEELIGATSETGVKIVMVTHDIGQARRLADEVLFLARGQLMEQRQAKGMFEAPRTAEARAFLEGRLLT